MKKFLVILLFPILTYGQTPKDSVNRVQMYFGGQSSYPSVTIIEKQVILFGQTLLNQVVLIDTVPANGVAHIYQISGNLNFEKNTKSYLQYAVNYTNENGIKQTKILESTGGGSTVFQNDSQFAVSEIWCRSGTTVTWTVSSTAQPATVYDISAESRLMN